MKTAEAEDDGTLSAECIVGRKRGYGDVHDMCTQTKDIPLPYGGGILLVHRCRCACHRGA